MHELLIYAIMLNSFIVVHTIRDNADRIKESAKLGTKVFVCEARLPQSYPNELFVEQDYHSPIQMNRTKKIWMWVSYIFTALEINKYIVQKCMYTV